MFFLFYQNDFDSSSQIQRVLNRMGKQFVLLFKSDVCFILREVTIHQVILQGFFETENLATTSCFVRGKKQGFSITER
jgi:hypothetical protein